VSDSKKRSAFEVASKTKKTLLDSGKAFAARLVSGKNYQRQISSSKKAIAALRRELTEARGDGHLLDSFKEGTPVFFVVGYQKSGTTWLMKMLDSHPEILCQGEGRPFGRNFRQEHLKQLQRSYPPASLYNAIASSEDLRYWVERSVWSRRDDTDEHLVNLTRLAIEYFLTQQLLRTDKRLVGDKTVLLSPDIVREISTICPASKVIHIIRDGRDVAVSVTHHRWNQAEDQGGTGKLPPDQLAKREIYRKDPQTLLKTGEGIFPDGSLRKYAARWSRNVSTTIKDGPALLGTNYSEVRYENLLRRPEEEAKRLLEFLGADASEQTVKECVNAASFEKLAGGRERGQEAASFFRKGIAGDWKNVFTEHNKQDFKAGAGDLLIELGYEEDNNW
jgi:hypothetical protein